MRVFAPIRLSLLATLVAAAPALAGPPWIAIEYPANPYDAATRGALLTLHTYHHGVPIPALVSAQAEGLVNGEHRSVALTVRSTDRPGVFAVSGALPAGGTWVIAATMREGETGARATALLALGPDGRVAGLSVPLRRAGELIAPREATAAEIDAMLRAAVASSGAALRTGSSQRSGRTGGGGNAAGAAALAGLGLLTLVPVLRRRRRERTR